MAKGFDPNQPRNKDGEWSESDSGSGSKGNRGGSGLSSVKNVGRTLDKRIKADFYRKSMGDVKSGGNVDFSGSNIDEAYENRPRTKSDIAFWKGRERNGELLRVMQDKSSSPVDKTLATTEHNLRTMRNVRAWVKKPFKPEHYTDGIDDKILNKKRKEYFDNKHLASMSDNELRKEARRRALIGNKPKLVK